MGARLCEPQHLKRHESRACCPNRAERGGKDQVEVASDDFCESILGVLPGVSRKQLQLVIAHFHKHIVATGKTGRKMAVPRSGRVAAKLPGLHPHEGACKVFPCLRTKWCQTTRRRSRLRPSFRWKFSTRCDDMCRWQRG